MDTGNRSISNLIHDVQDHQEPNMKRRTSQREAIQEVFLQQDRPMGVEDILLYGREFVASLNQATVYRNLKVLVDNGWLHQISHPALGTLYERSGKEHHHHFHCHSCNQIYCLAGCPLNHSAHPDGFEVEEHELFLSGICPACREKQQTIPDTK
jgi:Fur family ferric uptake transcriptional regulator